MKLLLQRVRQAGASNSRSALFILITAIFAFGAIVQPTLSKSFSAKKANPRVTQNSRIARKPASISPAIPVPPSCASPPSGMVSWWPAEGNANDIVSHNNGTPNNGATFAAGEVGQGFSLDGVDDEVAIGNAASLKLNSITIDAWVNPTNNPVGLQAILTKWNQNTGTGSGGDSYGLFLINNSGTLELFSVIHLSNGAEPNLQAGTVPTNQFSHVAMTYDSATGAFAIYVNGSVVASTTVAALGLVQSDVDVHIGRENDGIAPRFFP